MQARRRSWARWWPGLVALALAAALAASFEDLHRSGSGNTTAARASRPGGSRLPAAPGTRRRKASELGTRLLSAAGGNAHRAAEAVEEESGSLRRTELASIVEQWARRDPATAWRWVLLHEPINAPDGETSEAIQLLQVIAADDPGLIGSFIKTVGEAGLPPTDRQAADYAAIVALVTTGKVQAARTVVESWLAEPGHPSVDTPTVTLVAMALAQNGPPGTAAAWLDRIPGTQGFVETSERVGAAWAQSDPKAAMAWASAIGGSTARCAAVESVFAVWSSHDPEAAANWFLEHDNEPGSSRLASLFVRQSGIASTMPEAAASWAKLSE